MPRVIIAGAPKVGKTTLSKKLKADHQCECYHTDDLIGQFEWGKDSEEVSKWFDKPEENWIVEGVTTVRALRKWLDSHKDGKPCDTIYFRMAPREEYQAKGQHNMAKGIQTVWKSIETELLRRGVQIEQF